MIMIMKKEETPTPAAKDDDQVVWVYLAALRRYVKDLRGLQR